ncbi:MAG: Holliday junction branch migration DNA helicase RuvB, partial [Pseudomonadota bacterium]|nr:Holliday junction branch migration DNA helicase RuvB [Pseudomonadota bacterium]
MRAPEFDPVAEGLERGDENTLRPLSIEEFIGQEKARENLRIFVTAAK